MKADAIMMIDDVDDDDDDGNLQITYMCETSVDIIFQQYIRACRCSKTCSYVCARKLF